jgi:hypothetical protein
MDSGVSEPAQLRVFDVVDVASMALMASWKSSISIPNPSTSWHLGS